MAEGWSRPEVEATVAAYFDMLERELRGEPYNKSQYRRKLAAILDGRSEGAIERKHQNISAVLLDLRFVYISGYKPLSNYQQLLFDIVSDRLNAHSVLHELVRSQVLAPAVVPPASDYRSVLVDPPSPDPERDPSQTTSRLDPSHLRNNVDYLAMEASNRSLGAAGEEFIIGFEMARLTDSGCRALARRVERVSLTRGDALGFDVLSFETSGKERFIEVKTTAYGPSTPFFVTRNELATSRDLEGHYHLYRLFEFRRAPRLFVKSGRIDGAFDLEPKIFEARL